MIQLTFQPALDPFHAMFRLLRIQAATPNATPISVDHARIIDFYLAFPFKIEGIRLQPSHKKFRALSRAYLHTRTYGEQPEDAQLFSRMAPMQLAAMETLAANGVYDANLLRSSWLSPGGADVPAPLRDRVEEKNEAERDLVNFLELLATEYSMSGPNGLKHRTGLMEYRYDVL